MSTWTMGWDVSTSYVGVSLLYEDRLIGVWGIDLSKCADMWAKYKHVRESATSILETLSSAARSSVVHYVEDRLGNFTKGLTTLQTLMVLAQFNAVVSCHLNDLSPGRVKHILPVTVKRIVGFKKDPSEDIKITKAKLALKLAPTFVVEWTPGGNLKRGVGDKADAYLLALAGWKVESGQVTIEPRKKAPRRKARLGRTETGQGRRARLLLPRPVA